MKAWQGIISIFFFLLSWLHILVIYIGAFHLSGAIFLQRKIWRDSLSYQLSSTACTDFRLNHNFTDKIRKFLEVASHLEKSLIFQGKYLDALDQCESKECFLSEQHKGTIFQLSEQIPSARGQIIIDPKQKHSLKDSLKVALR